MLGLGLGRLLTPLVGLGPWGGAPLAPPALPPRADTGVNPENGLSAVSAGPVGEWLPPQTSLPLESTIQAAELVLRIKNVNF